MPEHLHQPDSLMNVLPARVPFNAVSILSNGYNTYTTSLNTLPSPTCNALYSWVWPIIYLKVDDTSKVGLDSIVYHYCR